VQDSLAVPAPITRSEARGWGSA